MGDDFVSLGDQILYGAARVREGRPDDRNVCLLVHRVSGVKDLVGDGEVGTVPDLLLEPTDDGLVPFCAHDQPSASYRFSLLVERPAYRLSPGRS